MCGRIWIPEDHPFPFVDEVITALEKKGITIPRGEVSPGGTVAVLACGRDGTTRPFAMRWGYMLPNGKLVFNTRSETAMDKLLFRDGLHQRRCLFPVSAYFEWTHNDGPKIKYAIEPDNSEGFYLAGIYRMEQGAPVCSVLTRTPADEIAFIHNRMPVIIPEAMKAAWLNPKLDGTALLPKTTLPMRCREINK